MDSGYYAAMTGLIARTQALDIAATNLANAQTPGFRSEQEFFRSALMGPDSADSQLGRTVNNFGLLGGDRLNLGQGSLDPTGNPLDLAIEGEGFFQLQTRNGLRYTRDGSFHRAPGGLLVTAGGDPVLSTAGQPIPVPPGQITVGEDGVLSAAGGVVATVGVFTFTAGIQLTAEGTNRYMAPEEALVSTSKAATVHQGALETANQGMIPGTLNLILVQREAEMMQKALTIFHTDFNKFATEDLPRV
ncbi:MAG: flagellar hook basal-body protein [Terracidiphilus sp.]|jgi:flagellar basal-body rod protein FlgF/flagellar basal-body rod protein FlgG